MSIDYSSLQSLTEITPITAEKFGDVVALHDPHSKPEVKITYRELNRQVGYFAAGLQALGLKPQDKVAFFADNSPRWFIGDRAIMTAGGVDVVRSAGAEQQELVYILQNSDSTSLVVENLKIWTKLRSQLKDLSLQFVILLSDEQPESTESLKVLNYQQLIDLGKESQLQSVQQDKQTLATLLYTSGTTGKPKGVMLTHGNLLHQVNAIETIFQPQAGDKLLSILPSWHAYERAGEYFFLAHGCTQIYTNIRYFKKDLTEHKPVYMMGVPRLWESLHDGIQKQLKEQSPSQQKLVKFFLDRSERYIIAKRIANNASLDHFKVSGLARANARLEAIALAPVHKLADRLVYRKIRAAVGGIEAVCSGGGSLARYLDDFYETIGIDVFVGYGLSETSPITNARTPVHNVRGTAGKPLPETEIKIVDPQTRETLPQGETGLVLIRGTQVMQGYYNNLEATAKAIDSEGWFDSGDLGWVTPDNDLVLTGRAKDTIVLTNGENIEPQPIEDACVRSIYIEQIMLVGQDQRSLGALIVPNIDNLQQWAKEQNIDFQQSESSQGINSANLNNPAIENLYRSELNREIKNRPGYRADDLVKTFRLILEPFSIEAGTMTQTLKIKRPVVRERYRDIIEEMFAEK
ncbi:long-chain fatty acid--CoA ligase [Myxosarcina sp. GI1]|uniref:AMP-dependent synthetase/ligase n=1 Tax=Myxosarcina sp. GI1 TaxID=1541065 RepID=UPI000567F609|nr:AMP-binding protein [Myxosarcina sp. GI1]